ncbi:unnamed protein product, partial [Oncorhynchus mykiss]
MPDHDSDSLLSRQTKRRRVDIGVKRTVGSTAANTAVATTSADIACAKAAIFNSTDCSMVQPHGPTGVVTATDSDSKSNVLRKLLKRANSYEDAMMPFPGATIISQLLKSNMAKNGGGERGERGE